MIWLTLVYQQGRLSVCLSVGVYNALTNSAALFGEKVGVDWFFVVINMSIERH